MRLLVPALVVLAVVTGCGRGADPGQQWPTGRSFISTQVDGYQLVPATEVNLTFQDGKIAARAGCNHFSGPAGLEGDRLVVGKLSGTAMACAKDRMAQDGWLSRFLANDPTMRLDGHELTLSRDGTVLTLLDETVAGEHHDLRGTRWSVETLMDDKVAASLPAGVRAHLTISAEGEVSGYGGCNTIGGKAEWDASTITFQSIAATRKSCGKDADDVEREVLGVLRGTVEYRITGDTLALNHPSGHALQLRAE